MAYHGGISPDDPEWNAQARLVTALQRFCQEKFGNEPSDSSLKEKIPEWLKIARKVRPETENKV